MKSKSTIEVNGKRYDAATGAVVGVATAPTLRSGGRNIDGFFRPRATTRPIAAPRTAVSGSIAELAGNVPSAPELKPAEKSGLSHANRNVNHARPHVPQVARSRTIHVSQTVSQAHSFAVRRGPANHVRHHVTQHSRTLRRDTVPAPQPSTHNLLRPKAALQHTTPGLIEVKQSASNVDPDRLVRAQSTPRSPFVARHAESQRPVVPTFASLAVASMPDTPQAIPTPNSGDAPPVPSPQPTNKPTDIFEHALANANNFVDMRAHRTHYRKKVHTHVASMALGSLALIVIAAFVAYQNNPSLQLKLASLKAGVSTSMPNFAAAGFHYNGVQAGDGKLTLGFKGTTGSYQLTQANTNLSDTDMLQTVAATDASGGPVYSVVHAGSVAVYRFSNTDATWVSNGRWYTVSGNAALSDNQVKSLVQHT